MGIMTPFQLRAARPDDVPAIAGLVAELAAFEQLSHLLQLTPETLAPHLFGPRPVVEAVVAERSAYPSDQADQVDQVDQADHGQAGRVVAYALFFTNFSTFLAKPGLYLEDLYVQPACRGQGIGQALLAHLAALAVARDYGRFEWSVLDWNEGAIGFYQKMGATLLPDWRICRVAGPALQALGAPQR